MKKSFKLYLLICLIPLTTFAIGAKKDLFFHNNAGCPLNAICSKTMGTQIKKWEKLIANTTEKNKVKNLSAYHQKQGLPIHFLTTIDAQVALDPVMWSSRCKFHNPKNPHRNVYKAMKFLKSSQKSKLINFTKIWLYDGKEKITYYLPYQDQVVLIQNNKLVVTKDYDDFYYQMSFARDRSFQITNLPHATIRKALDKQVKEYKCPDTVDYDDKYFSNTYCQKVLDLDTNKLRTIQYTYSCP